MRKSALLEAGLVGGALVATAYLVMYAARRGGLEGRVPPPAWLFFAGAATHLAWESTGGGRTVVGLPWSQM